MHFTTLFILKGEKLEDLNQNEIEEMFSRRFCYNCGETHPIYRYWCDWFQVGGRWFDILKAKRGIHCESGWSNDYAEPKGGSFSICEIKDLTEPINRKCIYAVATKSRIYQSSNDWTDGEPETDKFSKLLNDIDNKKFDGVIALIDCHD